MAAPDSPFARQSAPTERRDREMRFKVPRDQIPWHPTIDVEKCAGCRTCFDFCRNGVYEWDDENGKPVVKRPHNCIVGCSACSTKCPVGAIMFPPLSILKQYI